MRIAAQSGVRLQNRGGQRGVLAAVSAAQHQILTQLALRAGVSPSQMLARLACAMLADGPERAARMLGKGALPKRPYRRRTAA
jgi:hypothetical protein